MVSNVGKISGKIKNLINFIMWNGLVLLLSSVLVWLVLKMHTIYYFFIELFLVLVWHVPKYIFYIYNIFNI